MASSALAVLPWLRAVASADTVVARIIPAHGVLEWITGIMELAVLVLATVLLVQFLLLLLGLRRLVQRSQTLVERVETDTRGVLQRVTRLADDVAAMGATVRRDVERLSAAGGAIGDALLDATEITRRRVDEVNAVLDLLQEELEDVVLTLTSWLRALRGLSRRVLRRRPRPRPRPAAPPDA